MRTTRVAVGLLLLVSCGLLPGCSGRPDRPATFPAQGKVTYQGKPVAGATVAFLAPGAPRLAVGTTDNAGSFRLTTYEPNDGAVLGSHVVTVSKRSLVSNSTIPTVEEVTSGQLSTEEINAAIDRSSLEMAKARSELPVKYADRKTSDLHLEVVDGENVFEIELAD
jgi:hypothetical protein